VAEPQSSYPESATLGGREEPRDEAGEDALRRALAANGEDLAAVIDRTEQAEDLLTTAILVAASADEDELEHITDSTSNLVRAADGISTEGTADLAADLGANAEDLGDALDSVVALQRAGHLDDLLTLATAFSASLSPAEVEELATMLEESGTDLVAALDAVLELQREGHLDDLVATAKVVSTLEIDESTARGLNDLLSAVGEAQRESEPVGLFGALRRLLGRDARAGLGYLVTVLRAQGRRLRDR
jgi:uncharacterized protein YjgD (DUF1641 family)